MENIILAVPSATTTTPQLASSPGTAQLLRVMGLNVKLVQAQECEESTSPTGRSLILNFVDATLADANATDIFKGQIFVRVHADIPAGSMAILSRLFQPFDGFLHFVVTGTYTLNENYAEVVATFVNATNIQPN